MILHEDMEANNLYIKKNWKYTKSGLGPPFACHSYVWLNNFYQFFSSLIYFFIGIESDSFIKLENN